MKDHYELAHLSEEEKQQLLVMEQQFKTITGKNCVLIAWQKDD